MRNLVKAAAATVAAGTLLTAGLITGRATAPAPAPHDRTCTFDGGGTIASGTTAAVSTGQTYFCSDGTLVRFYG
jgi:hypothetical protein